MAYLQSRKNKEGQVVSYSIRVYKGRDPRTGKQLTPYTMTWRVPEGWSEKRARKEAEKQAAQWVARPGTSEHNLGLAADIVSANWYAGHDDLTADFDQTPEFEWLQAHCAEYGFILRYPQGKETCAWGRSGPSI